MTIHKTLKSDQIYSGPIFNVVKRTVQLPDGKETNRDVIEHHGAAVVVAITDNNLLVMVRQYRPGSDQIMLELPAGKLDHPDEDPKSCALRELKEETGYHATKIKPLLKLHPVAAYCTEKIFMFLADGLVSGTPSPDEDEYVDVELHSLPDLLTMIDNGEITDMKTIAGLLFYSRSLE